MVYDQIETAMGPLVFAGDDGGLRHVGWLPVDPTWKRDPHALQEAREQLVDYFAGARTSFDLRLAARGTPFQNRVWSALVNIPYGETRTYGELAEQLDKPGAARAVGNANRTNPLAVIVPCHRVIGASGKLTGYAGGLDRKRALLALETRA